MCRFIRRLLANFFHLYLPIFDGGNVHQKKPFKTISLPTDEVVVMHGSDFHITVSKLN